MDQETKDILLMLVDGFKDMRADIKEMKADITTMKSDIADLQKEQASMREDITALKAGVHEVQAISQALRHQQEVMNAKLDNLTFQNTLSTMKVREKTGIMAESAYWPMTLRLMTIFWILGQRKF